MESRTYLKEAAKWARFLGILGFVGSGFILLFMLIFWYGNSEILGALDGGTNRGFAAFGIGTVAFIYIIIAVVGFLLPYSHSDLVSVHIEHCSPTAR